MSRVDLKIDGKQTIKESFLISAGKDIPASGPTDILIASKQADDSMDVCGFGQPISAGLVSEIADGYFLKSERAWSLLEDINKGVIKTIPELTADPRYIDLRKLLDPANQIVSGVFGKEIILNMIGRKGCEGIRYVIGDMEDKMTVVLIAVRDVTKKGDPKPTSEPLAGASHYKNAKGKQGFFDTTIPPDTEVHNQSLTREQVKKLLGLDTEKVVGIRDANNPNIADFLLGPY